MEGPADYGPVKNESVSERELTERPVARKKEPSKNTSDINDGHNLRDEPIIKPFGAIVSAPDRLPFSSIRMQFANI
ncbi:hypothetical protein QE152_g19308 [Popillia japonica]|uniref:Uncharacterized protein n=1 Tax=Popillia japonica TaxID=7064 RepID=A0AAW1KRS5_POPJA